ncbi:MAG: hypothetical protein CMP68_01740 [Flavobacteriales bacterium]|nr:hypothetical protein [Flavobacteriales bacterium]
MESKKKMIPHAQLFYGPIGSEKLKIALAYIQFIFCLNKKEDDSCGQCSNCKKNELLIHPDVHFIFPVTTQKNITKPISLDYINDWKKEVLKFKKLDINSWTNLISKGKKNLVIYVNEIYDLEKKINLKSYQGDYKVFLIWEADKLNLEASNKMLKSLEEPPEKTIFILISNDNNKFIPTIQSRLIPLKFYNEKSGTSKIFIENGDKFLDFFVQWVRICFQLNQKKRIEDLILKVDEFAEMNRTEQKEFLIFSIDCFRKSFLYGYGISKYLDINISHENFSVKNFSPFIHKDNIFKIIQEMNDVIYNISRNANTKLLFLDLSFNISKQISKNIQ